ncbi:unnamed protein product [Lathyrus oleraceus]|uniref:non-specific serine/threonine protein kinase n=1 Tax=Pisum sativum TaxID=3888 RepID=A0A9D5B1B0_PEA|nr:probable serine/threonine-protein kinase PBL25 [Pisum sativum]KAI5430013.1 putative serine/threonine-protein kinase pbl26 [Pisum sativum]
MSCFSCFSNQEKKVPRRPNNNNKNNEKRMQYPPTQISPKKAPQPQPHQQDNHYRRARSSPQGEPKINKEAKKENGSGNHISAQSFTFRELASITRNFRQENLIGEGGFGRVYRGRLEKTNQEVAVKQLDRNGLQGNREFLVEVLMLSLLHHRNLVNLIGYCADGEQRLLVYEYMPLGSLEDHLLDLPPKQKPLEWLKRMKVALDAAKGLEYLHDRANPPVIYRDLKSSNILLDNDFNAKLSDFGLAKLGPTGDKSHVSSRVMGTYGYCAPEYQRTGQLTVKSDIYSFGVVLLELITGRRTIDNTRPLKEQNLVYWAYPVLREPPRYTELADPKLEGSFPMRSLHQAVAIAAMCLNEEPSVRPLISDVVTALSFLNPMNQDQPVLSPVDMPSPTQENSAVLSLLDDDSAVERQKALDEAIEWGSNTRNKPRHDTALSM